jgi:hypothetical protein
MPRLRLKTRFDVSTFWPSPHQRKKREWDLRTSHRHSAECLLRILPPTYLYSIWHFHFTGDRQKSLKMNISIMILKRTRKLSLTKSTVLNAHLTFFGEKFWSWQYFPFLIYSLPWKFSGIILAKKIIWDDFGPDNLFLG